MRVAGDALGVGLVQDVDGGDRKDTNPCVHSGDAALVAQRDQECAH